MVESSAQQEKQQSRVRYDKLRQIEQAQQGIFAQHDLTNINAPEDYSSMSFDEKNNTKYMCTFPYPYMNGYLHLGHAFSMSKCEYQVRYQRQRGKNALFPFGFHCTGMPIQAAANRLKKEITSGNIRSKQPTAEEKKEQERLIKEAAKKKQKLEFPKVPFTQYEILMQLNISEEEIPKFQEANYWLEFFPPRGQEDLKEFGLFADWRRSFITTSVNPFYNSFIEWQFHHLKENNKIKYGKRYTIFSVMDGQPCADHDRAEGEGLMPQEYTGIKIKLLDFPESLKEYEGKNVYLVAATLRPETMYGQTNCFILPDGDYGLYEMVNDEYFIVSERGARNMSYQDLTKERGKYPCLVKVKGSELIGKSLKAPLTSYEKVYCLPLPSISMEKGTGVVTSVPSDSPDDFAMLRDLQTKSGLREKLNVDEAWCAPFEPIPIIDTPGMGKLSAKEAVEKLKIQSHKDSDKLAEAKKEVYLKGFNEGIMDIGEFKGMTVQQAKPLVKNKMIEDNLAVLYHEPEGLVMSRSGDKCIVASCYQWMLDYGEENWKNFVMEHVKSDKFEAYNPKTLQEFEKILDWLREWGCSRTQGLGTLVPWDKQFVIESLSDSTIYMAYYTVAHLLQGGVLNGSAAGPLDIKAEDMTIDAWNYVMLGKEYAEGTKIPEETLSKLRHEFNYWYPMDMRCSGKDLIRNHLTMSLYNHAAIWNDKDKMTRSYFCNGYLMLNGEKMSKSTGNFLTVRQCIDKYGVDATRVALADSGDTLDDANFEEPVANKCIMTLFVYDQWIGENIKASVPEDFDDFKKAAEFDQWDKILISVLNKVISSTAQYYEEIKYKLIVKHAYHELLSIKEEYILGKNGKANPLVLLKFIEAHLILLNPIVPHFSQHCWTTHMVPVLKKIEGAKCEDLILNQGWPEQIPIENQQLYVRLYSYIKSTKASVSMSFDKAKSGGKKKKGQPAAEKVIENCAIFVALEYPELQKKVLELMNNAKWEDNKIDPAYKVQVRELIKDKKQASLALGFGSFIEKEAATEGKDIALQMTMSFNELEVLEQSKVFIFDNKATIKNIKFMLATDEEEIANSKQVRDAALPGKPGIMFY